jgi:hypothetical protein
MKTSLVATVIMSCALGTASIASAQSGKRWDVPEAAVIQDSTKAIVDVYKTEYEAAKTPQLKQTLAKKLIQDAEKTTDDPAARYALLQVARKIATGIGDVDLAMQAVDATEQAFRVESGALRKDAITTLAPLAKSSFDHFTLTRYAGAVLEEVIRDDQYDVALELTDLAIASAKKASDPDLVKQWLRRQQAVKAKADAHAKVKDAFDTLSAAPTDAPANARAGRFLCFVKNDWARGLPMLALGEDGKVRDLATQDLKGTDKPAEQAALADAWFDLAETFEPLEKSGPYARAADYYQRSIASLSAIAKRRAENRMAEIAAANAPFVKDEWIEVLDFVDLNKKDGQWNREGKWLREGLTLVSDGRGGTYFAIPVAVDGSYEMEVTFAHNGGWEGMNVSLSHPCNGANFQLNSRGETSGLSRIDGRESANQDGKLRVARYPLQKERINKLKITVLRDAANVAVAAEMNNARYFRWNGLASKLTEPEITQSPKKLNGRFVLGGWDTGLRIYSVRVKSKLTPARLVISE